MSQQEYIERREEQDVDQWLRSRTLSELRRLAEFCGVPIKRGDHERDIIDHLRMGRRDDEGVATKFDRITHSATAFDVENLQAKVKQVSKQSKVRLNAAIAGLRQDELSKVGSKLEYLEAQSHRNESLRSIFGIIAGAVSFMICIAGIMGLNLGSQLNQIGDTAQKTKVMANQLQDLENSKKQLRQMMVGIGTHTGISMINKLNDRLDQLRTMKSYHITSLTKELALELYVDLDTIRQLQEVLADEQNSDAFKLLRAIEAVSTAIRDLPQIYDGKDLDLKQLRRTRKTWAELHDDVTLIQVQLLAMSEKKGEGDPYKLLGKLKASVYQIEAGLAIQEYRDANREAKSEYEHLLDKANQMCDDAIHADEASTMAYINKGLISSLKLSLVQLRNPHLEEIERDVIRLKNAGETAYTAAIQHSQSQELTNHALNNLAYLFVKTGNTYANAVKEAEQLGDREKKWHVEARRFMKHADDRINQAMGIRTREDLDMATLDVDPIILTTKADIEISRLPLLSDSERDEENRYETILHVLKQAVDNGYSGYQGPWEKFIGKRPHFKYLELLNEDYPQDVCKAVGIPPPSDDLKQ